jgi:hypothetical protein
MIETQGSADFLSLQFQSKCQQLFSLELYRSLSTRGSWILSGIKLLNFLELLLVDVRWTYYIRLYAVCCVFCVVCCVLCVLCAVCCMLCVWCVLCVV